ncbi:MAG: SDR family oxidoreductase [Alphaproteobacteria bacterium]|jgi:NAD(P)-dependent dehydrogenase (short-subunit alcohol dehydrogenase family)|nr:SDR family oxidoreductase [Alphaproteobacteria bacterium]
MKRLEGKVGIITGAVRGIGRATAERFSAEGASLVLADIDGDGIEKTAAEISAGGGNVVGQRCDVSDAASCEAVVKRALDEFGKLNVLMNNAAYFIGKNTVEEVDIAEWRRAIDVNLTGPMLMSKYAIPAMRASGGGSIIHVASQLGSVGKPMRSDYCAVKGGLIQMARSMAADHVGDNIRVNSLSPGPIGTERIFERSGSEEAAQQESGALTLMGRVGLPTEIANAALFLASDESSFMTGDDLLVDGGYNAL